jgi:hypothetical protein
LSTTSDGKRLVINKLCEDHNHEIHETLFKFLPRQRQLSSDERKDVENMLKVQENKKMVQHYIMEKTGEKVGLKDLHNIQTDRKKKVGNKVQRVR